MKFVKGAGCSKKPAALEKASGSAALEKEPAALEKASGSAALEKDIVLENDRVPNLGELGGGKQSRQKQALGKAGQGQVENNFLL